MTRTPPPLDDHMRRMLEALEQSAVQARRIAAQTGTRLVYVHEGELILEDVPYDDPAARPAPPPADS